MLTSVLAVIRDSPIAMACFAFAVAASSSATVTDFRVTHTSADSHAGEPLILNDLQLSFDGSYHGSQLLVELDAGSIYHHPYQSTAFAAPASPAIADLIPSITADTYHANGADFQTDFGQPFPIGGPVNIDPFQPGILDTPTQLALTWGGPGAALIHDQTDFRVFRLALTPDADGSFRFFTLTEDGYHSVKFDTNTHFAIEAGHVVESNEHPNVDPPIQSEPPAFEHQPMLPSLFNTNDDLSNAWQDALQIPTNFAFFNRYKFYDPAWFANDQYPLRSVWHHDLNTQDWRGTLVRNGTRNHLVSQGRDVSVMFTDGHKYGNSAFLLADTTVLSTPEPALLGVLIPGVLLLRRRSR
ncbi:MAG: hypothetical protein AAF328_04545 [Planctomycetota bacterium]